MNNKTIGSFIAALRRASGMTQRELAEKLNVSDKAVSRWERDECAPDVSLIPVIADLFGVTADELLRGERRAVATPPDSTEGLSDKGARQLRRLLEITLMRFRVRSLIAGGIAGLGVLVALLVNFAFLRATIGFWVGCILLLVALVFEVACAYSVAFSVKNEELDAEALAPFYRAAVKTTLLTFSVILVLFAVLLPLATVETYAGLDAEAWLTSGALFGAGAALICAVLSPLVLRTAERHGVWTPTEEEQKRRAVRRKLWRYPFFTTLAVLATLILYVGLVSTDILLKSQGTTFQNYADFTAFMETYVPSAEGDNTIFEPLDEDDEISTEVLCDDAGRELCRYIPRNRSVVSIEYSGSPDLLPITVYTHDAYAQAQVNVALLAVVFVAIYIAEIAVGFLLYRKKFKKLLG